MLRPAAVAFSCIGIALQVAALAQQADTPAQPPEPVAWTVQITSPLGRTGVVTKVRIVAQVLGATPEQTPIHVLFHVDGQLVGEASGAPYAVEWLDDNPFERRELVVQARDMLGRIASDTVVLPAFQITDQSEVTNVLLEAGVYDKQGRFVSHLGASDFVVRENGTLQKTATIARQSVPTTIVLLVDNSQSMSRRIDFVRDAAERLGEALRQRDRIIVAPFNKHLGAITGPTDDARTIGEAIAAMRAEGGTAIVDALVESTRLFVSAEGRRVVILITDGYDEHSTGDMSAVLATAMEQQIAVYVVGIGGVAGISLKGERLLQKLAEHTGGRVHLPSRESQLRAISDAVTTDVFSRYLISYEPSNRKKDGTWREIRVEVPDGFRVVTRPGYFAPSPPPIRPTLEFTVMNESNEYLEVAPQDLELLEDGVVQQIDTYQEAVEPVSMVLALDASGSMVKSADSMRDAAGRFVGALRADDRLAMITFADRPQFEHMLGTTRQFTFDAIASYKPAGGTALYDALHNALMALKGVSGRRAVVVLTDGRDENNPGTAPGSEHTLEDVLTLVRSVDAAIFPIGLGGRVDRQMLETLSERSGGASYFPADVNALDDQYRRVLENLRRRYVLSYTSTNSHHDGSWRAVEIKSRLAGLRITTRGGYFAPAQ